ncbi:MAG TPA: hypothetical protein VHF90_08445 [Thermoleophilaceae bacterium]|nr:hypothetical protein [Thermoleophilaceae bacterium]
MSSSVKIGALLAAGRIAAGAALLASPGRLGAAWLGDAAARPATQLAIRALGARDIALGAGALTALGDERRLRRWIAVGAVCDLTDAGSAMATPSTALPDGARQATVAMGAGAALAGALAHRALR